MSAWPSVVQVEDLGNRDALPGPDLGGGGGGGNRGGCPGPTAFEGGPMVLIIIIFIFLYSNSF